MKEMLDFNVSGNLQPGRTCFDNIRKIMKQFSASIHRHVSVAIMNNLKNERFPNRKGFFNRMRHIFLTWFLLAFLSKQRCKQETLTY